MVYKRNGKKPYPRIKKEISKEAENRESKQLDSELAGHEEIKMAGSGKGKELTDGAKEKELVKFESSIELKRQKTWLKNLMLLKKGQQFSKQWLLFNMEELLLQCMGKRKVILGTAGREKAQYVFQANTAKQLLEMVAKMIGELRDHAPSDAVNNNLILNFDLSNMSEDDIKQLDIIADQEQSYGAEVVLST